MKWQFILIILCLLRWNLTPAFAMSADNDDYFKSLALIKKPPQGTVPILPCSLSDKKQVLKLLAKLKSDNKLSLNSDGSILDQYHQSYEIYKGDFSNEGVIEYAVISTGGTLHANSVTVYKLVENQLIDIHLDKIISKDLLNGGDIGPNFYLNTADPFAVISEGKTYIRYMDFPYQDYDKTKLILCTYLWEKNHIVLSGPNLTFSSNGGSLIKASNCIA